MPHKYWFSGEIRTTEPVTQDTLTRIADRLGFPIEGRGVREVSGAWLVGDNNHLSVWSCSVKKNTLNLNFYYNSDRDVKRVAMISEEEFGATSGQWLLAGKWVRHLPVSDIIGACDCIGTESWLCDACIKAWPPVDSAGKKVTCSAGTECYVNGVRCWISNGRYDDGTIEIVRHTDRVIRHREKLEKLKKRHACEIEDEAKDFDKIRKWHVEYAARRQKELQVLAAEFKDCFGGESCR
jgi:hypothetical protein